MASNRIVGKGRRVTRTILDKGKTGVRSRLDPVSEVDGQGRERENDGGNHGERSHAARWWWNGRATGKRPKSRH